MTRRSMVFGLTLGTVGAALALASPASADMKIMKAAKEAGFEAKNCQYCHTDKLPKKDAHAFNDRGQYLVDQKAEKKADAVDVNWLKDYVEKEEKK